MAERERCSIELCEKPVAALLEQRSFCTEHFVSTCYAQLETYTKLKDQGRLGDVNAESVRRFINESTRQADLIEQAMRDVDNLERARLADIILWAADLGRHVRRSPRKAVTVPVRLCCDGPGQKWEEETETRLVSQHGALVACRHPIKRDETFLVERKDTGLTGRARVTWWRPRTEGVLDVGIELLDQPNFWELEWS